ncbi:hypothetical protein jhhlp_001352 [Lomentospora prolificans]|uniref:Uncharacterized protein n=1 Tax=Lomentospora prolificans TaxID=41688 RepID=A0A2N3NHW5_9PEZI|nr:hypothetical protein jhhlp_001352 [Lomentospora prolificans]
MEEGKIKSWRGVGSALDAANSGCPTITAKQIASTCSPACTQNHDCRFISTVTNPCGCPRAVPEATLIQPCNEGCPYDGCAVEYRTVNVNCVGDGWVTEPGQPSPTLTTKPRTTTVEPPPSRTTSQTGGSSRSSSSGGGGGITPCPKMTKMVASEGCVAPACPTPNCIFQEPFVVSCGCPEPETVMVEGCVTECPQGCATTTVKVTENCWSEEPTGTGTGTGAGTRTTAAAEVEESAVVAGRGG